MSEEIVDLVADRIEQIAVDVEGRKCALLGLGIGVSWSRRRMELTLNLLDPETEEILIQLDPVVVKSEDRSAGFTMPKIRAVIPVS